MNKIMAKIYHNDCKMLENAEGMLENLDVLIRHATSDEERELLDNLLSDVEKLIFLARSGKEETLSWFDEQDSLFEIAKEVE